MLLLSASLVFYAFGEPAFVFAMAYSIVINHLLGILIYKLKDGGFDPVYPKLALAAAAAFNIAVLAYFKYSGSGAPPVGVSFFTLQTISYAADIYSGRVQPQKNILGFAFYAAFFPKITAGPVMRYSDIEAQLKSRSHSIEKAAAGAQGFIVGLAKIVLIANPAAGFACRAFGGDATGAGAAWLGAVCFALQVYFWLSGYSDMAAGLGGLFGFELPENFDYPYASGSVRDFWRRWHISLTGWFKEYLYIPLGGNKKGALRTYINLWAVFAAAGLWHGAGLPFLVWGLYHGLFLTLERGAWGKILQRLPYAVRWAYTALAVLFGWVIFGAGGIGGALGYIKRMFDFSAGSFTAALADMGNGAFAAMLFGMIFCAPAVKTISRNIFGGKNHFGLENLPPFEKAASWASVAVCSGLLILSVIFLK